MSVTLDVLQAQVLSLPRADRSRLLDRLVASLDMDTETEAQWEQLAQERDVELASGTVAPVALQEAIARVRSQFHG